MAKLITLIRRNREGIIGGSALGAGVALWMDSTGKFTASMINQGGLLQSMIELPSTEMAFVKLLFTAVILGGTIGYVIQEYLIK